MCLSTRRSVCSLGIISHQPSCALTSEEVAAAEAFRSAVKAITQGVPVVGARSGAKTRRRRPDAPSPATNGSGLAAAETATDIRSHRAGGLSVLISAHVRQP